MRIRGAKPRHQLGDILLAERLIRSEDLNRALEQQNALGYRLGTNLLDLGLIDEDTLLHQLSLLRHVQTVSSRELRDIPPEIIRLVPAKLARRYRVVPYKRAEDALLIASMDPGDALIEDELGSLTSCLTRTAMGLEVFMHAALERYYRVPPPARLAALAARAEKGEIGGGIKAERPSVEATISQDKNVRGTPKRPRFIEVDDADHALLFPPESDRSKTPEENLAAAAEALQAAEIRDDVADQLLKFAAKYFRRRVLLVKRMDQIVGWRGSGNGVTKIGLRTIALPLGEPSVFQNLADRGLPFWRGPMPPFPAHTTLTAGLGGSPKECVVLPILLRERVACYLYADNGDGPVKDAPIETLRRLAHKAGLALEVVLLRSKIRAV